MGERFKTKRKKERRRARFGRAGLYLGARLASAKWRRANPIDLREATKWDAVVPGFCSEDADGFIKVVA